MKKNNYSLLVMCLLLFGMLYLGAAPETTSAVGNVSPDIKPGNTYYYDITSFPSIQGLLDLVWDQGMTSTGSFQGSQIYVKIIDTNMEILNYFDGSSIVTGLIPTVDISAGLITSEPISIQVTDEPDTITLPAGSALPIPLIFGDVTQFNVTSALNGNGDLELIPFPFVLNDDYALHEVIATLGGTTIENGSIKVDNTAAQFRIDFQDVGLDPGNTIHLNGFLSYRKTDGLAQEFNFDVTNSTSSETLIDVDIDLAAKEYHPLFLSVGDTYNLKIDTATFDYTVSGQASELSTIMDNFHSDFSANMGKILYNLEVMEIDGLYYRVEGSVLNTTDGTRINIPADLPDRSEFWMHGFGRYGPGMPVPTEDPFNDTVEYWDDDIMGYLNRDVLKRENAVNGPFIVDDSKIYEAWDITTEFVVSSAAQQILDYLSNLDLSSMNVFSLNSSTGPDPVFSASWSGQESDSGYDVSSSLSFDLKMKINDSYINSTGNDVKRNNTLEIALNANIYSNYDEYYVWDTYIQLGGMDLTITEENSTDIITGSLSISYFNLTLVSDYYMQNLPATPPAQQDDSPTYYGDNTDDSGDGTDDGTDDSTDDTSGNDSSSSDIIPSNQTRENSDPTLLPGFSVFLVSTGLFVMMLIVQRKSYH